MNKIVKDDGTWRYEPTGIKDGNLPAWKAWIATNFPFPKDGMIVIRYQNLRGYKIGYRATLQEDGTFRYPRVVTKVNTEIDGGVFKIPHQTEEELQAQRLQRTADLKEKAARGETLSFAEDLFLRVREGNKPEIELKLKHVFTPVDEDAPSNVEDSE